MKMLKYGFLFLAALFISACGEGGDNHHREDDSEEFEIDFFVGENDCYELVFPISVIMHDGSVISGDEAKQLREAISDWHKENGDEDQKISFQYPLDIIFGDELRTVETSEQFERIKKECEEERDDEKEDDEDKDEDKDDRDGYEKDCFELIFPVTYVLPDGSTATVANGEAYEMAIKEWYENHPDSKEEIVFQFPFDVKIDDKVETIENEDELKRIKALCSDRKEWGDEACYKIIFPLSLNMPDGSIVTADSKEALSEDVKAWYEAHPDFIARPTIQYPINIFFDDEEHIVNSDDEFQRFKDACEDDEREDDCFELVFPINYVMPDASTVTGNNAEELRENIKEWYDSHPDAAAEPELQFPVDIIFDDGTLKTLDNQEDYWTAKENC